MRIDGSTSRIITMPHESTVGVVMHNFEDVDGIGWCGGPSAGNSKINMAIKLSRELSRQSAVALFAAFSDPY